jgi:hypothetical protein
VRAIRAAAQFNFNFNAKRYFSALAQEMHRLLRPCAFGRHPITIAIALDQGYYTLSENT